MEPIEAGTGRDRSTAADCPRAPRSSRPVGWILLFVLIAAVTSIPATVGAREVRAGDRGFGLTVFEGREPERFEVEILGRLTGIFPAGDLILARVSGHGLESSGIVAGMSGSPIIVDGELIGALAYAWQFASEPICGITPIEAMRAIPFSSTPDPAQRTIALPLLPSLGEILGPDPVATWREWTAATAPSGRGVSAGPAMAGLALAVSGFAETDLSPLSDWLGARAVLPAIAGGAVPLGSTSGGAEVATPAERRPQPGGAVAAMLVGGDLAISAIGTVTSVDGDRLLAFGHPFLGLGPSEIPLAAAEVVTVLPSLARSVKFGNAKGSVGVIVEDRNAGISAVLGRQARTTPLEIRLSGEERPFRFRIARSAFLSPMVVSMVTDAVVSTRTRQAGETTVRWALSFDTNAGEVRFSDIFSGFSARNRLAATVGLLQAWLTFHPAGGLEPRGVRLDLSVEAGSDRGRLIRATMPNRRVRAGETVPVRVELQRLGAEASIVHDLRLSIPADFPPGRAVLLVGDGRSLSTTELLTRPADPKRAAEVVLLVARLRPADRLAALLFRRTEGAVVDGTPLPDLPSSVRSLLPPRTESPRDGGLALVAVSETGQPLPFELEGSVRLEFDVSAPTAAR